LELTVHSTHCRYHLRGIIYYAAEHFTARVITGSGMVWYHDGLLTGQSLVYENSTNVIPHDDVILKNFHSQDFFIFINRNIFLT
ncbi:hypothetical protein L208DRAFT_1284215, partial [Tricholoma matsutake]